MEKENEMTEYRNENEIAVHSLGRSGSHAIVNWIASMFTEPVYFFNNCGLRDPFGAKRRYVVNNIRNRKIKRFFANLPKRGAASEAEKNHCRNAHKQCLMYSYEHRDIRKLEDGEFMRDRTLVGKSRNRYRILILRDFFNWAASISMTKSSSPLPQSRGFTKFLGLWQVYAGEFLGRTDHLKEKICISFNQWFVDEDYRIGIADSLDLKYSDITLDYAGSPSSFDAKQYRHGKAQEMKVLDRWRIVKDDANYREYLDGFPRARELSYEIFGKEIGHGILDGG